MKFNKTSLVTLVICLSAAVLVGCKPIFEKKPLPPKDDAAAAAPAAAPAPAAPAPAPAPTPAPAAPAPTEAAKIEDVQSLQTIDSEANPGTDEQPVSAVPEADDGDDVVKTNSAMMRNIQQALVNAGFNPGPVDGKSGGKTVTAIEAFQKQNGLSTGKIDKRTLRALGVAF